MKKQFITLCLLLHTIAVFSQTSKWPYFGEKVPPYIAVAGAYEGFNSNTIQAGIMANVGNLTINPSIGGMAGGGIFYKQSTIISKIRTYEAEVGIYGGIVVGFNYNYNITTTYDISGFKPFAGVAFFNAQLFYGYNFYKSKNDQNSDLRHHRFTFRYVIPTINLSKKDKPKKPSR